MSRKIENDGLSPSTNYTSSAKQRYRDEVWAGLSGHILPNTWAVIMPARGCEEIETAISYGVPQSQILCFDGSAAVIATSLWRKKYPEIKFITSRLSELAPKIAKTGKKVSAINMDMCGNFSGPQVDEINTFLSSGIMAESGAYGINIAKGREGKQILRMIDILGGANWLEDPRLSAVFTMLDFCSLQSRVSAATYGISQGKYRENKTPMTWATVSYEHVKRWESDPQHISKVRAAIIRDNAPDFYAETQKANEYYGKIDGSLFPPRALHLITYGRVMAKMDVRPTDSIIEYCDSLGPVK